MPSSYIEKKNDGVDIQNSLLRHLHNDLFTAEQKIISFQLLQTKIINFGFQNFKIFCNTIFLVPAVHNCRVKFSASEARQRRGSVPEVVHAI